MSLKIPARLLPVPKVWMPTVVALGAVIGDAIEQDHISRSDWKVLALAALYAAVGYSAPRK